MEPCAMETTGLCQTGRPGTITNEGVRATLFHLYFYFVTAAFESRGTVSAPSRGKRFTPSLRGLGGETLRY